MKALPFLVVLLGISCRNANAQPDDFFGVYAPNIFVGSPTVTGPDPYPFTPSAEEAFSSWDEFEDAARQNDDCAPERMPGILWIGSPKEITEEVHAIVVNYERGSTRRTIHMDGRSAPADTQHTNLGFSVGRWQGEQLIVETTHLTAGNLRNNQGHPLSSEARLMERYWRDEGLLMVEVTVEDPVNYTESFTLRRDWLWAPEETVEDFGGCFSLGDRDEEPDLDELTRMLESF